ncbi:HET-domain-containing protein [Acephala macrosclerotiorum]|nr:HET-domain-containing protein [Acephala macrosclerotiorum]
MAMTGEYAALSHCWGGNVGLRTYKSSLQAHLVSIDPSMLSKTAFDAVAITRGLGLRFLWVDTLCIVQDSQEDWKSESATMDAVYRNAIVTIAASSAKDGRGGCLLQSSSRLEGIKVPITKSVLPKRILHFRNDRVIWECKERLTAEDYLDLRRDQNTTINSNAFGKYSRLSTLPSLDDWLKIVEDYSRRKLTIHMDKLFAMAGLSNFFKSSLGEIYLDGIWLYKLHSCLLWISATGGMQQPPTPRAPSWSWAAPATDFTAFTTREL